MSNSVQFYLPIPVLLPNYILEPRLQLSPDKQCSRYPLNTRFGSVKSAYCLLLITLIFFFYQFRAEARMWKLVRRVHRPGNCTANTQNRTAVSTTETRGCMYRVPGQEYRSGIQEDLCTLYTYTVHCTLYTLQCTVFLANNINIDTLHIDIDTGICIRYEDCTNLIFKLQLSAYISKQRTKMIRNNKSYT